MRELVVDGWPRPKPLSGARRPVNEGPGGSTAGLKESGPPRVYSRPNSPREGRSAILSSVPTYSSHGVIPRRDTVEWKIFTTRAESATHAAALSLARLRQAARPALTAEVGR